MPKRLVVPHIVSSNPSSTPQKRGTRAFVPLDHPLLREELELQADVRRKAAIVKRLNRSKKMPKRIMSTPERRRIFVEEIMRNAKNGRLRTARYSLLRSREKIASESDYFVKPTSERIRRIRSLLLSAGVLVETPLNVRSVDLADREKKRLMTDLGNGLELFSRGSYHHFKFKKMNRQLVTQQVLDTVAKMHALGITHRHLHLGNWVMDPKSQQVQLLDLSLAQYDPKPPASKKEFLNRFGRDLSATTALVACYRLPYIYEGLEISIPVKLSKEYDQLRDKALTYLLSHNPYVKRGWKISLADVQSSIFG